MNYPTFQSKQSQTQTLIATEPPRPRSGVGEIIDLGVDALGLVALVTATVSDVNLDGGTPGDLGLTVDVSSSFNGTDWGLAGSGGSPIDVASGEYFSPGPRPNVAGTIFQFHADDPAPLYSQFQSGRFLRFNWSWSFPADNLGPAASATVTLVLDYF